MARIAANAVRNTKVRNQRCWFFGLLLLVLVSSACLSAPQAVQNPIEASTPASPQPPDSTELLARKHVTAIVTSPAEDRDERIRSAWLEIQSKLEAMLNADGVTIVDPTAPHDLTFELRGELTHGGDTWLCKGSAVEWKGIVSARITTPAALVDLIRSAFDPNNDCYRVSGESSLADRYVPSIEAGIKRSAALHRWAEALSREPTPAGGESAKSGGGGAARTIAVLEFRSKLRGADQDAIDIGYFSDLVRGAALRASPGLHVMTRENLLVLLQASGKDLANCEGECEVDTGRRVGADLIVSGEALKVGSVFKLNLKLHETHEGRLLAQAVASGHSVEELDTDTQRAVQLLVAPLATSSK